MINADLVFNQRSETAELELFNSLSTSNVASMSIHLGSVKCPYPEKRLFPVDSLSPGECPTVGERLELSGCP